MPDKLAELGSAVPIALRRSLALLSMLAAVWLLLMATTTLASSRVMVLATGYLAGGALLLNASRWSMLTARTWAGFVLGGLAGTGLSLWVRDQGSLAAFSYTLRRGYPLHAMHKTGAGASVAEARAALAAQPWRPDWGYALADLLFWGYCGLAVAVLVTALVRLARS
ncbi:hypothetical protein [Catenuloplanes japonicus]|uniref:hypothetical protein n=1 Tax=Catenuloplanes japonicus TaxID=33876 RepID=UPI0005261361|nr:hypothetical protein [Catenuloplanes japonicus]